MVDLLVIHRKAETSQLVHSSHSGYNRHIVKATNNSKGDK